MLRFSSPNIFFRKFLIIALSTFLSSSLVACGDNQFSPINAISPQPTSIPGAPVSPAKEATPTIPVTSAGILPTTTSPKPFFNRQNSKNMLEWAQLLVQNINLKNTTYQHKSGTVTWANENGATGYSSYTDCSGLIAALLTQTYGLSTNDFQTWLKTDRPLAKTFESNIAVENGFIRIDQINQAKPGDLLAIKYPPGNTDPGDDTGHIMLITGLPQSRTPTAPQVKNTLQWDIPVIDSAQSGHGKEDTRRNPDGTFREGLGQGIFRVYTDADGKLAGYSWSDLTVSQYYDRDTRPFIIGRVDPAFNPANN